jgi:hypothetical protein
MFGVLDLAEERRPSRIIVCILALANHVAKHVKGYQGPVLRDTVDLSVKTMYSRAFIDGEDVADVSFFLGFVLTFSGIVNSRTAAFSGLGKLSVRIA